jgi:hypothetical protein
MARSKTVIAMVLLAVPMLAQPEKAKKPPAAAFTCKPGWTKQGDVCTRQTYDGCNTTTWTDNGFSTFGASTAVACREKDSALIGVDEATPAPWPIDKSADTSHRVESRVDLLSEAEFARIQAAEKAVVDAQEALSKAKDEVAKAHGVPWEFKGCAAGDPGIANFTICRGVTGPVVHYEIRGKFLLIDLPSPTVNIEVK